MPSVWSLLYVAGLDLVECDRAGYLADRIYMTCCFSAEELQRRDSSNVEVVHFLIMMDE